jgi:hypothetical protein
MAVKNLSAALAAGTATFTTPPGTYCLKFQNQGGTAMVLTYPSGYQLKAIAANTTVIEEDTNDRIERLQGTFTVTGTGTDAFGAEASY